MTLCIHFSYDAQRPSYQNPQRRYVAVRLRNEERPSVFFGTIPVFQTSRSPSFPTLLTIVNFHIFSVTYPFCFSTYFLTMMMIDHDAFLPAVVMTSYTPCCTNISRQKNQKSKLTFCRGARRYKYSTYTGSHNSCMNCRYHEMYLTKSVKCSYVR
jgi:hypothetical protein